MSKTNSQMKINLWLKTETAKCKQMPLTFPSLRSFEAGLLAFWGESRPRLGMLCELKPHVGAQKWKCFSNLEIDRVFYDENTPDRVRVGELWCLLDFARRFKKICAHLRPENSVIVGFKDFRIDIISWIGKNLPQLIHRWLICHKNTASGLKSGQQLIQWRLTTSRSAGQSKSSMR
jgi:hypothetical protein